MADEAPKAVPETVKVVAPGNLEAGYKFEATVDTEDGKKTFSVTVPDGGVKEGEEFEVPYPTPDAIIVPADKVVEVPLDKDAPAGDGEEGKTVGAWRHGLCACFDVCCQPICCMAYCCEGLLIGQLLQRFKLDYCGVPTDQHEKTCKTVTGILVCYLLILVVIAVIIAVFQSMYNVDSETAAQQNNDTTSLVGAIFGIYFLVASIRLRLHMRQKYEIPTTTCCPDVVDDCLCIHCCTCCTLIQMARQSHDEEQPENKYQCCTDTGLIDNMTV